MSEQDPQSKNGETRFDEFWKLYPHRRDRGHALRAWRTAVKKAPPEKILAAVAAYRIDPNLPEKQFIPMPSTWLNGERWEDGPLPPRSNGNGYREPERVEVAPTGRHRYPTATHGACGQSIRYDVTTGEAVDFETCQPLPHHCPATGQIITRGSQ